MWIVDGNKGHNEGEESILNDGVRLLDHCGVDNRKNKVGRKRRWSIRKYIDDYKAAINGAIMIDDRRLCAAVGSMVWETLIVVQPIMSAIWS